MSFGFSTCNVRYRPSATTDSCSISARLSSIVLSSGRPNFRTYRQRRVSQDYTSPMRKVMWTYWSMSCSETVSFWNLRINSNRVKVHISRSKSHFCSNSAHMSTCFKPWPKLNCKILRPTSYWTNKPKTLASSRLLASHCSHSRLLNRKASPRNSSSRWSKPIQLSINLPCRQTSP